MIIALTLAATGIAPATHIQTLSASWSGHDIEARIKIAPFQPEPKRLTIVNQNLMLDGKRVYWYSDSENRKPENKLVSISISVTEHNLPSSSSRTRKMEVPANLLGGLFEPNLKALYVDKEVGAIPTRVDYRTSLWVSENAKQWQLHIEFFDGGCSFASTFSGDMISGKIKRYDIKEIGFHVGTYFANAKVKTEIEKPKSEN